MELLVLTVAVVQLAVLQQVVLQKHAGEAGVAPVVVATSALLLLLFLLRRLKRLLLLALRGGWRGQPRGRGAHTSPATATSSRRGGGRRAPAATRAAQLIKHGLRGGLGDC